MTWTAVDDAGRDLATGRPPATGGGAADPVAALSAVPVPAWPVELVASDGRRMSFAEALASGGERVARLLDLVVAGAPVRPVDELARATPAGSVDLPVAVVGLRQGAAVAVDGDWLAEVDRRRTEVRGRLVAAGRGDQLEAGLTVALLVAGERFDPADNTDVDAHTASGARLWLLAGAVAGALAGGEDPFAPWAELVAGGWWPIGPSSGRLVVAAATPLETLMAEPHAMARVSAIRTERGPQAGAANLAGVLEAGALAGGWADDVAYLVGDRRFTHRDVHEGAARMARLLAGADAQRGDRVLLALPDGIEFVWSFLGAVRMGAVAVPVNPRLTEADHRDLAADAGAGMVVCPLELAERFDGRTVITAEALEASLATHEPVPPAAVGAGDPAYAQYTSGTTGAPKRAVHAHNHPPAYYDAFARPALHLDRNDTVLSVSKLYFAYGLGNALFFPLLAGCATVLHLEHPQPGDVADLIARHHVTVLYAVPTFYAHLVATGRSADMASVRVAVSAGEPLLPALAERARDFLGCPLLDGLGSTEVGQTFASNTLAEWRDGTVGRVLPPYRVSVRDGALFVAGPTLPLGTAGEWLATGDRATIDEEGFLRLHGRTDDMELVGGISVAPAEVEAVLSRHSAVIEVAVAGVVSNGASRLESFVVATNPTPELASELLDLARTHLAPFKVPREVTFVAALPRTPTGKLRRFVLRAGAWPPP